jgi:hypothetical protein
VDTHFAVFDLTALDLRIVALMHFNTRSLNPINAYSKQLRLRPFSLQVNSHNHTVSNPTISNRKRMHDLFFIFVFLISFVFREAWRTDAVDATCVEVFEVAVGDHYVGFY